MYVEGGGGARADWGIANAVLNWSMIGVGFHCSVGVMTLVGILVGGP